MKHIVEIISQDQILKVLLSLIMGAIMGLEREYKRKAAGMRTMTLICMSATVFTILSAELGNPGSPDRVASNILTGVGFIGAGVIFKGEFAIDGITTAASIWIATAMGMAIGMSQYLLATFALTGAMIVLVILKYVEEYVAIVNDKRFYTIYFYQDKLPYVELEKQLQELKLKYSRMLIVRKETMIEVGYAVRGHKERMQKLDNYLLENSNIWQYQVQNNPL
ncbi:putative Mg2+ transporter-C (MgtC) family protein [Chitinophaga dinghuensis]|uniref:Putative Mg2+ transporter-C (MgtC) family protein n=1 Tax=Chitinophaga dinghuensis TaxID=1539050 RepID=A0A327VWG5_9BACT|nr:MgtC/SapB family protein [Chitinophaga dinghuensis]RAJ79256.1 putative Mg2+ transporter-C (MgtC) family protein [Chitinophaga dinghuensis]